jgi:hypothetical protein
MPADMEKVAAVFEKYGLPIASVTVAA